jgi:hypothetical protein
VLKHGVDDYEALRRDADLGGDGRESFGSPSSAIRSPCDADLRRKLEAVVSEVAALVDPIGGALTISDETPDPGYLAWDEIARVDVMETHVELPTDLFSGQPPPFGK